jgi:hypothetical protein
MKLDVYDIDRFVELNQLQPVTGLTFFEATGTPTDNGLFSFDIFGRSGSDDRKRRWGYIELHGRFLHPLVYKTLSQLDRKFPDLISGSRRIKLTKTGMIQDTDEDDPNGWTGLDELYNRWDDINWGPEVKGTQRGERIGMLKVVPKKLAFITKWPVMPASFRDVDTASSTSGIKEVPPINYLYIRVMSAAPTKISGLSFIDGNRKRRAQEALVELHKSALDLIAGKKGLIQDRLLGKYTDWATRGVLSGPAIAKSNKPGEQEVPFGYIGVPLYLLVNMFQPFVIKRLSELFRIYANGGLERMLVSDKNGNQEYYDIPRDVRMQLGPDLYKKWISRFMRSQENRLDLVSVVGKDGGEIPLPIYDKLLKRGTTLLDLFFLVVSEIIVDKRILFTRYPVEDFRACHFAYARILTVEKTERMEIVYDSGESQVFERYPTIEEPMRWIDSFRINNSYTKAMGADYDGVQRPFIFINYK